MTCTAEPLHRICERREGLGLFGGGAPRRSVEVRGRPAGSAHAVYQLAPSPVTGAGLHPNRNRPASICCRTS
jgi:hypothetical protein